MLKSLVIVESPAKAKTIEKYLGKGFKVKASIGHIKDLPKSKLGVDVKKRFEPEYQIMNSKKKVVDDLRKAAVNVDQIYLALDPDREGEAIAWHVSEEIFGPSKAPAKSKSKSKAKGKTEDAAVEEAPEPAPKRIAKKPIFRVLFHEITKKAVLEAIEHPIALNKSLYEAQKARRVLDRLVGYQVSPILWDKVRRGLSAGRVQTVALRLICEREKEIKAFVPEEYWSFETSLQGSIPPAFMARLVSHQGKKIKVGGKAEADVITAALKDGSYVLKTITRKERRRNPLPPFITSRLQQDASQKLGYSAARTMMLAQQLYEGVDLGDGEGPVGLITYMRTDSTRISDDALAETRGFIGKKWGAEYLPEKPNVFKNKKSAQDAHEAIRPTSTLITPEDVKPHVEADLFKLYELIWRRFVSCQMTPAVFDQMTFDIESGPYGLRANGSQMKFAGFLTVYEVSLVHEKKTDGEDDDQDDASKLLPALTEGETLKLVELKPEQHFTEPPPRFNDASIIRELEEKGIGRPSTYAAILSNITEKEYVRKELRIYTPTELGLLITDILVESFPDIFNVEFTARMESELDEVEEGKETLEKTIRGFYNSFKDSLESAKLHMRDVKRQEIPTDFACEKCQSAMVIKWGRRGEFLACTKYPECKYTREFERLEDGQLKLVPIETTDEVCHNCQSPMAIKSGRFGKFLACTRYPDCKTTRAISSGFNCPNCGKGLARRRTKKGRFFYGCVAYPNCKFASWDQPLKEACPQCQSPTLFLKSTKTDKNINCPKEGCGYTRPGE